MYINQAYDVLLIRNKNYFKNWSDKYKIHCLALGWEEKAYTSYQWVFKL